MSNATTHIETEKQLVPELRFNEYVGDWKVSKLGDYCTFSQGIQVDIELQSREPKEGYIKFLRIENYTQKSQDFRYIPLNVAGKKRINADEIAVVRYGATAGFISKGFDGVLANNLFKVIPNEEIFTLPFLFEHLNSHRAFSFFQAEMSGGAMPALSFGIVKALKVPVTSLPEQQKIASFLSAVDEKIQQLTKKKELLEQYKKGVMQQLFSGQLRFKDENGNPYPDWEDAVMQDVFERVKEKNKENNLNVMSISAQQGLVNQLEYFNRYVSAADVTGYYLLKKGDFAYNKSYSKGYPMGAIKRLDRYDKGVVSTLYICFRIKENDDSTFYKEFLDHGGINSELAKIAQEGARNHGLLNMSVIEFFRDIKIPRPSAEEQIVIGNFLEDLSIKIESSKKELTQTQTFKKGLLQQMFV